LYKNLVQSHFILHISHVDCNGSEPIPTLSEAGEWPGQIRGKNAPRQRSFLLFHTLQETVHNFSLLHFAVMHTFCLFLYQLVMGYLPFY